MGRVRVPAEGMQGGKAVLYGEVKCQNEIHIRMGLKTRPTLCRFFGESPWVVYGSRQRECRVVRLILMDISKGHLRRFFRATLLSVIMTTAATSSDIEQQQGII